MQYPSIHLSDLLCEIGLFRPGFRVRGESGGCRMSLLRESRELASRAFICPYSELPATFSHPLVVQCSIVLHSFYQANQPHSEETTPSSVQGRLLSHTLLKLVEASAELCSSLSLSQFHYTHFLSVTLLSPTSEPVDTVVSVEGTRKNLTFTL